MKNFKDILESKESDIVMDTIDNILYTMNDPLKYMRNFGFSADKLLAVAQAAGDKESVKEIKAMKKTFDKAAKNLKAIGDSLMGARLQVREINSRLTPRR
jgi:hypothetical protein